MVSVRIRLDTASGSTDHHQPLVMVCGETLSESTYMYLLVLGIPSSKIERKKLYSAQNQNGSDTPCTGY